MSVGSPVRHAALRARAMTATAGRRLGAATAAAGVVLMLGATTASAHDVHHFGTVTVALGWVSEPAYTGVPNAVQVIVTDAAGKPVAGITDRDLTVSITAPGNSPLARQPLVPTADPDTGLGRPGEYTFAFIPTIPGAYSLHVAGSVAGQAVDETVVAGATTFALVTDPTTVEYPAKVPSTTDINTKTDRVGVRAQDAQGAADSARTLAYAGIAVGGVALVVTLGAGGALLRAARRRKP